jgi:hypothetical protein
MTRIPGPIHRRQSNSRINKYRNVKTEIDGHLFDSKAEAQYFLNLKVLHASGEIRGFSIQPSFMLPGDIRYRPDFLICDAAGQIFAVDVKGVETAAFKLKRKLWEKTYPWLPLRTVK